MPFQSPENSWALALIGILAAGFALASISHSGSEDGATCTVPGTHQTIQAAADVATELGLGVNAGHDLNLVNLSQFANKLNKLLEVSIGHAFTVDALLMGIPASVAAYQKCLGKRQLNRAQAL